MRGDRRFTATRAQLARWSRLLTCTRCGWLVEVFEIPEPFLDAETYVCGACLKPVAKAAA